jgi:hypothetical protein
MVSGADRDRADESDAVGILLDKGEGSERSEKGCCQGEAMGGKIRDPTRRCIWYHRQLKVKDKIVKRGTAKPTSSIGNGEL